MNTSKITDLERIILVEPALKSGAGLQPKVFIGGRWGDGDWTAHSLGDLFVRELGTREMYVLHKKVLAAFKAPIFIIGGQSDDPTTEAYRQQHNGYLLRKAAISFPFAYLKPVLLELAS